MHHWHGSYCIIPNISTFLQCLKDRNWIHPTEQVLKREVTFEMDNDDALAEICIVDKDTLGSTISLNGDKKISKRKVDSLAINASTDNDADTVFETFPKCSLHVYEKIPSSSRLKIKSLCASEQESSEFNLATPTLSDHKFILHNDEKDTGVLKLKPSKPQELTVHKDRITKTTITLSWKGPSPPDSSIFRYEVEHRKFGEDSWKLKNIPIDQNLICEVTELTPYTKYEFRVAAINSAGRGPFTDAVTEFTKFDCTAAVINLTKQLCTLTNLKYDNMKIALMGKNVITDSERREIDTKIGQEKMLYVIVDIVIPSLKSNFYKKYRGFLEAMEESYDIDLKSTAKILGGSKLVTWNPEE